MSKDRSARVRHDLPVLSMEQLKQLSVDRRRATSEELQQGTLGYYAECIRKQHEQDRQRQKERGENRSRTTVAVFHRRQSDEWFGHPRDRFEEWNREFGFTLDVAATVKRMPCVIRSTQSKSMD